MSQRERIRRYGSSAEVAELLGLRQRQVCELLADGQLPGRKLGRLWRIDLEELERLMLQNQQG